MSAGGTDDDARRPPRALGTTLRGASRAFWVAVTVWFGVLAAAYLNTRAQAGHARWTDHTWQVIRAIDEVRHTFAATTRPAPPADGDAAAARRALPAAVGRVAGLVRDNPAQTALASRLDALVAVLPADGTRGPAADEMDGVLREMEAAERALLDDRLEATTTGAQTLYVSLGIVALLGTIVAVGGYRAVRREIRDRGALEREARAREARLRDLYDHAPCGYHSLAADGTVVEMNATELRWLGRRREDVVGRVRYPDLLTPAARAVFAERFPRFVATGEIHDVPLELLHVDGSVRPVAIDATAVRGPDGAFVASRSTVVDVAARRRAEAERDRVVSMALDLVLVLDLDGTVVHANPAWERTLGWPPAELHVGGWSHLVHPDDVAASHAAVHALATTDDLLVGFENRYRRRDGSWRWISWSAVTDRDAGRLYCFGRDVTTDRESADAIRALNDELARRNAALDAANRELDAFAYSVSHDLRAPLRSIDGFSQALVEDCRDRLPPEGEASLRRVRAASQRMGQLIDDLLQLARITRTEARRERVDLSALAREVLAELAAADPARTVETDVEDGCEASADPRLVRVALENLLGNAWKFTSRTPDARVRFGRGTDEEGPHFLVGDNGVGFDMAYAHKLFGAFQRLHAQHEFPGTGIGLATVQRIVRLHGGRVRAESAPGAGATFRFTLAPEAP
ncbi:MAG: PAS domain S-box protein [Planctomycetota bacterium]